MGSNWKARVGQLVGRMTAERAKEILANIRAEDGPRGATIFHPDIRELTGGYNSQSINGYVIRKLGVKAGIIRNAN